MENENESFDSFFEEIKKRITTDVCVSEDGGYPISFSNSTCFDVGYCFFEKYILIAPKEYCPSVNSTNNTGCYVCDKCKIFYFLFFLFVKICVNFLTKILH